MEEERASLDDLPPVLVTPRLRVRSLLGACSFGDVFPRELCGLMSS